MDEKMIIIYTDAQFTSFQELIESSYDSAQLLANPKFDKQVERWNSWANNWNTYSEFKATQLARTPFTLYTAQ